jgi:hypothetical protein
MAISYVGGQTAGRANPTSALSVNFALTGGSDAAPLAGDLVVVCCVTGSAAGNPAMAVTTPTGYTALGQLNQSAQTNDTSLDVSYKIMTATPDTAVTIPGTTNNAWAEAYSIQVFRGVDATTPMDVTAVSAGNTGTGRPDPATIAFATAGAWTVICGGGAAGTGANYTAPANYTTNFVTATGADTTDAMVGSGYNTAPGASENPAAYTGGTTGATDSWAAYTLALRPAADAVALPSISNRSELLVSAIHASWAAVVAVPLFASVLLQGAAPAAATPPPPRDDTQQYAIHQQWTPPPWETQVTRKVPTSGPAEAVTSVPFSRASQIPISQWLQQEWPAQTAERTPIPDAKAPYSTESSLPITLWPPLDWPTQQTRKIALSGPDVTTPPNPKTDAGQKSIQAWPQADWSSQVIRKAPIPDAIVAVRVPLAEQAQAPIALWVLPEWPTQTTRKTVIPDAPVVGQPPFSRAAQQPIRLWEAIYWDTQRPEPVLQPGITPSIPWSRASSVPIALWPPLQWELPSRQIEKISERSDAPPFGQRLWLMPVVASWEPGPPQPIIRRVVWTPDGPPTSPVGEPYWRAEVEGRTSQFEAADRVLQFPAKDRRFTMD